MSYLKPGIGNASSYQVAGKPFVTGNLSIPASGSTPLQLSFPQVTKKIIILNPSAQDIRLGFSAAGVNNSNYVIIHKKDGNVHGRLDLEVKCTSIFLLSAGSATSADVAAELTSIDVREIPNNWSGSLGVG